MYTAVLPASDEWALNALEQARIIVAHLEGGGRNGTFLKPHALHLAQEIERSEIRGMALIIRRLN
jgi:hypothetical protein